MQKGIIKITALAVAAVLMAGTVLTGCNNSGTETVSTAESVQESQLKDEYELVELDENTVYFADIDIKDYGKIIVKLDQKAAPISCANFVALANMGFYTGEGNGKPLQYSCLENPMNSMKRQNDRILKEELPRSVGAQYALATSCEELTHWKRL